MHADTRTLAEGGRARMAPVVDTAVKPAGPATVVPTTPATAAETPSGEKPQPMLAV